MATEKTAAQNTTSVITNTSTLLQVAMAMPPVGDERPSLDVARALEDAIYDAGVTNGGDAVDLCNAIYQQAKINPCANTIMRALNMAGFPAWEHSQEPPVLFAPRRHVALQYDVGGASVFVATLRPTEADEYFLQCARAAIRDRIAAELSASEQEWPPEEDPQPERLFARIDFLAGELRTRLGQAGVQALNNVLLNAWGDQQTGSAAQRMRQHLEDSVTVETEEVLRANGYTIVGLAQDPAIIIDRAWNLEHRRLFDEA